MSIDVAIILFPVAATVMMLGSLKLSGVLEQVSLRYKLSRGLMGLIAALGADSPEIASAFTAIFKGEHDLGIGIVLGSNLFNIAAMIGLGALIAKGLPIQRGPLIFNVVTSLVVTIVGALTIYRVLDPAWAFAVLLVIFLAYVSMLSIGTDRAEPLGEKPWLLETLHGLGQMIHARKTVSAREKSEDTEVWSQVRIATAALIALIGIIGGAVLTVQTALVIGASLNLQRAIVGSLVVAMLSSAPNAYTSADLARRRHGTAVISEAFNSNTINILVGLGVPAATVGLQLGMGQSYLEVWWLLAMTVTVLLLALHDNLLSRTGGVILVLMYVAFVVTRAWV